MKSWHFRHARALAYVAAALAAIGVFVSSWNGRNFGRTLIEARQLYGLWALGLLLGSMMIGPLTSVLPWLPFRPSLMYGRRAVGVSAFLFAVLHVIAYLWSVGLRHWSELYTPGVLWVVGLLLGLLAMGAMSLMAVTSRDVSVKRLGGRRWKRLHRLVYATLCVVLIHALFNGADFGLNHGPDVRGHADFGSLVGFLSVSLVWLIVLTLRQRHLTWIPRFMKASNCGWVEAVAPE